ncbi:MAG: DUF3368 domain-containing protein [Anaerolineales bacterium]|nr:DUF3368 domain-containing protein [Anaerolineales bacterium]
MKIVADASPLIALAILQKLDLLTSLFDDILVPLTVFSEATREDKPHAEHIRAFAQGFVVSAQNQLAVQVLLNDIDRGEAEAIVLALEKNVPDILIDDAKGRRVAQLNGLHPIGTVGVLLQAKRIGHIQTIKPLLDTLIANRMRISERLYQQALQLAEE